MWQVFDFSPQVALTQRAVNQVEAGACRGAGRPTGHLEVEVGHPAVQAEELLQREPAVVEVGNQGAGRGYLELQPATEHQAMLLGDHLEIY